MSLRRTLIALGGLACLCGPVSLAGEEGSIVAGVNPNLSEGAYALEFGNYEEGIRLTLLGLRETVRPKDRVGALSNLCAGYVGTQNYDEALRYCNRALRLDEKNWRAYNNRGLAYLGLGNVDAARRDVERGLSLNASARSLKVVAELVEAAAKAPPAVGSSPGDVE